MKKKILLVFCILVMLIAGTAYAAKFPDYLNGDTNFILTGGRQGMGYFLDRSSLVITHEDTRTSELAVNVLVVSLSSNGLDLDMVDNPQIRKVITKYYKYDVYTHRMYRKLSPNEAWKTFNPNGSTAETGGEFSGELAYYIAYKEKFSNGYMYPDVMGKERPASFSDEFYARADR